MAYRVLARKYRPKSFEEIIGQDHIATTLRNALSRQKVAHAYLFSGPRGVGKTTTARILAKALNCVKGPTPTPCNSCDSCERIAQGQEMVDVLEIDAASNRGIEEIRELRENVRYAPARSRYKVYIVDEAHQITHDAFNAFLKTLEEPPAHAVFVLATTEHQKIPATILSRCQLFRFKRVSTEEIASHLAKILKAENVSAEPEALLRLARAGGGSVRDALSLLDQALAYTPESLTLKQVETLLGFLPAEFLQGFAQALLSREPAQVLQWIKRLAEEGWELPQFVRDFREYLRLTLVEQIGAGTSPEVLVLGGQTVALTDILRMLKTMGQCLEDMRWNENPRLVLELYGLRLTQPLVDAGELLQRLEALEQKGMGADPEIQRPGNGEKRIFNPDIKPETGKIVSVPSNPLKEGLSNPSRSENHPNLQTSDPSVSRAPSLPVASDTAALWKQFIAELWKKPVVASHVERARLKSSSASEWVISFGDKFAMDSAQRSQVFIQDVLAKVAGRPLMLRFVHEVVPESSDPTAVTVPQGVDPGVQKILQTFKGRIRSVESAAE